ncbi:asparaginase [Pseudonocardia bannensis]|uniref:Asparaginase n=1 Tax=Pseudonocardia bannensis TaxID=630973 RepID=A0A848DBA1_9PSEU|nr:asparaginase [Pseudonocardia bannensis]
MDEQAVPIARVVRGGVVESVHLGHLAGLDASGTVTVRRGDPATVIFPRSSLKPVQAVAMLRAGLDLDGELLALACASHSGEDAHLAGVARLLAGAGLAERDLQNTPGRPLDEAAAVSWRAAGRPAASLAQNCSGKHAAMLATCVAAAWDTATYRDPGHPLQRAIRDTVAELTGDGADARAHVTVDGCGAPLFSCTLGGLARALARIATAEGGTPEHRVAAAIRAHPWWLGGTGRTVTRLIEGVPGLIAKDGAEGMFAAALPDGRAVALKVLDGAARPVPVVVAAALRALGADAPVLDEVGRVDVLGHGEPVGSVAAVGLGRPSQVAPSANRTCTVHGAPAP